MTVRTYAVYADIRILLPLNTVKLLGTIHHLLIVFFYALIILLYFLRSHARLTNRSLVTNTIAILATFIPFVLPILSKHELINPIIVIMADIIIILGMVLSIYSLSALGRNFSIIPQARKLVQRGPYRLVRHPLYLGELMSVFGIVLAGFTTFKIFVYLLLIALQIYRAFQEEKLLAKAFPEYEDYCSKTARFIPGLF
jgi:protein-S-isoprenylcysteine O-methyltransferase Ste14